VAVVVPVSMLHCHPHVVADHSRVHVVVGVEEHTDYRGVDLRAVG